MTLSAYFFNGIACRGRGAIGAGCALLITDVEEIRDAVFHEALVDKARVRAGRRYHRGVAYGERYRIIGRVEFSGACRNVFAFYIVVVRQGSRSRQRSARLQA